MPSYYTVLRASLYAILVCLFLTPSIKIGERAPLVRLEEILIVALVGYTMAASLSGAAVRVAWGLRQTLLVAFIPFIFVSIVVGLLHGYGGSIGDLFQLIRIAKYLAIYTICVTAVYCSSNPDAERRKILNFMLWLSLPLFAITVQQYYDLFGLNALYVERVATYHSRTLIRGWDPRAIGMIGDPNALGFLFVITALIAAYFLAQRFRLMHVVLLAVNLVGIVLTGSRTSLVAFAAGLLLLAAASMLRGRGVRAKTVIQALILMLGIGLAGAASLPNAKWDDRMVQRFEDLANPTETRSWKIRLRRWSVNLEMFKDSPLLGVGPLRRVEMPAADNEWLLLLRSYGVLGTSALVLVFLLPHWFSAATAAHALSSALLFTSALYMVTLAVFHSLTLMPVVLIVLALSETGLRARVLSGAGGGGRRAWAGKQGPMRSGGQVPAATRSWPGS